MSHAVEILKGRQKAMLWALLAVRSSIRKAERTRATPDMPRLKRIMAYLARFPQARHQPAEEACLFKRVEARRPDLARTILRLKRDHIAMTGYGIRLLTTLDRWQDGDPAAAKLAVAIADDYVRHCQTHVQAERRDLLPAALASLGRADWAEIERSFGAVTDPVAPCRSGAARSRALAELG